MRGLFPVEAQCPKIRVTRLSDLKAFSQDFSDFKIYPPQSYPIYPIWRRFPTTFQIPGGEWAEITRFDPKSYPIP